MARPEGADRMELTVGEIAAATGGRVLAGDASWPATSFTYDSRTLEPGACFFALRGNRDGHDFVHDAFERGALVAVVERAVPDARRPGARALVQVDDTLRALGDCGRLARDRLARATVVGVTGSAGKTSTKDLTRAALARRFAVTASPGSFNNESGLPLTLLGADAGTDVVVAEMGARFVGNIAELCAIARPGIGVVTNIGLAHAEHLGGREGIARVKRELLDSLPPGGTAVVNADDDMTPALVLDTRARAVPVGFAADPGRGGVRVHDVVVDDELRPSFGLDSPWGRARVELSVRGEHQVVNAGMAAAVALVLGVPVDDVALGLADATGASWRMQLERSPAGLTVLNDAYNASPTAVAAALRSFARLPNVRRKVAVLGEMLELGACGPAEHEALGRLAGELGFDAVVTVGTGARGIADGARGAGVPDVVEARGAPDALDALAARVTPEDGVLVKASRAVGLEVVADALAAGAADGSPGRAPDGSAPERRP